MKDNNKTYTFKELNKKSDTNMSIKQSFQIATSEYVKWIKNPKITLIFMMLIFIYDMFVSKMISASSELNTNICFFEPFIAVCNSIILILVIPAMYLGIMGDFPRVDGNSMFYLLRTGKINWIAGQIIFSIMTAITYMFFVFIGITAPAVFKCEYKNSWSDVTTKYIKYFPEKSENIVAKLIDGRLYNNILPLKAVIMTFTLMVLYMVLINMILMVGFTIGKHSVGIVVSAALICISCASVEFNTGLKWFLPTANVLPWQHYDEIYKKHIFNMSYSYTYFIILIIVLSILSSILIDNYDFSKISDMED